jgi:endonuclease YncB( thermonuclease family)
MKASIQSLLFISVLMLVSIAAPTADAHHVSDYLEPSTTVPAKLYSVIDGDTVVLYTQGVRLACRLAMIDAPENKQPLHKEAAKALKKKLKGREILIDVIHLEMDANIAIVIARVGDRNINLEMVREGWAETYKEFLRPPYMDDLLLAEKSAKESGKGIWGQEGYVSPVDFRQQEGYKEPFIRR